MRRAYILAFLLSIGTGLHAQIPRTLSYQGVLTDTLGNPRPDGTVSFTFSLYDTSTGGIAIWTETKNLQVRRGLFFTALGDVTPFGAGVRFDRPYWLGVKPGSDPELSPRIPLTPVGYSFSAINSDTAHFALTAPQLSLPYSGSANTGGAAFNVVNSGGGSGVGVKGTNSTTGSYGYLGGSIVGVFGYSDISNASHGVEGKSASNIGVYGENTTSHSYGFLGAPNDGVVGEANSGISAHGVTGRSSSNVGVYGVNTSSGNYGYLGGPGIGVYGLANSSGGDGVVGEANSGISAHGVTGKSSTNIGVLGLNTSSNNLGYLGGPDAAVYGKQATNYAGFFDGYVYVIGSVYVAGQFDATGSKHFLIDHPLDPEHKTLRHAAIESSEVLNQYSGNVVTDENGFAEIVLPDWFEALNKDFRYQLTVIGRFAQAVVEEKIHNNRFTIRTNLGNVEVSWQVTAVRNDAYMRAHPMVVEEAKPPEEQGTYLSPKEWGQPEEKGRDYPRLQKMREEQAKHQAEAHRIQETEQARIKAEQEKMNLERQKPPMLDQQRQNK